MNDIFHIQSRLVDGREQQCLANDRRGSFLIAGHPRSLLVYLCIGLLAEIQESLSTVPQATSVPGPLCCAENGKEVIESINHFLDTQTYPRENTTSQWLPHNCPKKIWLRCSRCRSTLSCPIKNIAQRYMPYSRSWSAILLMSTMPSPYSILTTKSSPTH